MTTLLARAVWALLLVAVLPPIARGQAAPSPRPDRARPNILFILADDWRWGDLGAYGNQELRTPHLDTLARQGTLFTRNIPPVPACRVAVQLPARPARVTLEPQGAPLAGWRYENGRLLADVPAFATHQMVVAHGA